MENQGATEESVQTGYAPVNGLQMYYEIRGKGQPLVLVPGAFAGIETGYGGLIPGLAQQRQVIAVELQGHARTADIDRPLSLESLANDLAALLEYLKLESADFFGYSLGAGVAFNLALRRPELVRKLVLASVNYNNSGFHPGLMEGMDQLQPEMLVGSPWHEEYLRLAPRPEDFPKLVAKIKENNRRLPDLDPETVKGLKPPTLLIIGDSDIIRPEHAVEFFRLLGGGVSGDNAGLPRSQLAILPGTSHVTVPYRVDLLLPMLSAFLDQPAA